MRGVFGLLLAVAVLSGCAGRSAPMYPWEKNAEPLIPPCAASQCDEKEALAALNSATRMCRGVHNYYESGGFYSQSARFGVSTLGVLSGAVFANTAKGSAAKAWSGLSGATNGIQSTLNETIGSAVDLKQRQAVATATAKGFNAYRAAGSPNEKVVAALEMVAGCTMASAEARAEALRSIIGESTDTSLQRDRPADSSGDVTVPLGAAAADASPSAEARKP